MAPVQAEPKVAENETACKAVIDMLERQLTDIQKASNEMAVVELLMGRTVQLMKDALETLKHFSQQEGSFTIIEKVTDIFVAGNEAGKEAKRCLVVSITESCIDVITSPEVILIHKIELLKSFNTLLENCPFSAKREILSMEHFAEKLSVLCKSIAQVGDYEVQVCIIEFIFRLVPKSMRIEYLKKVLDDSEQWLEFLDINDSKFEIDCRQFLNKLNKQNTNPMARVYSYPAEVVSIDGVKLYKPNDSGYDDFWVDLNEGSKRIGIFCEPNFLSSQQSQNSEQMWETVSIWAQDVKRYSCTAQGMLWKAILELKAGAEMISNKEPETLSHVVTIVVAKKYNFKAALENVLKIHHKASSVDTPVRIVQKPDLPVKSSTALSESVRICVGQTSSQKQEDKHAPSVTSSVARSKVSVPSEPMTTPASSVITSNTDQPILWQEIQERQRLQKKHLEKVSDGSDNAGKSKMYAVELCDREHEDKTSFVEHTVQVSNTSSVACYTNKRLESEKDANDRSCTAIKSTGLNKSRNTTVDKENGTYNLNIANENKIDVSEHSTDRKSYRSRSQAKVKASEKCTNMTLHYMDARASDALVDVVNSQVTASGDRLFSSQASPAKHGPTAMSSKNEVDKRIQCIEADAGEHRKCQLKGSCDAVCSAATDCQPAKTSARSLRSKQRAQAAAVVTVPVTKSDTDQTQSDLNHSQLDIIPATLPGTQRLDTRQLRGNRKSKNSQNKIYANTGEDEILKSSYASIPKDMKSSNKKRKAQQADTEGNSASKNINNAATAMNKVPVISPGNISLDDFKPSKNVRSMRSVGRKVAEKSDNTACKKIANTVNTGAVKDQNKAAKRTQAKEKGITCWLDSRNSTGNAETHSELKTLKDFLPAPQNREQIASETHNKITLQDVSVSEDNDGDDSEKENQISTVYIKSSSKSMNSVETSELDKMKEMGSIDRTKDMQGEVASISSSGELFIVTEASKETDKECDVIKETQYELSSPVAFDTEAAHTGKKRAIIVPDQLSKPGNVNSKIPDASGDCISSAVVTNASLNLENSYIFDKSTAMKINYNKTTTFEDKQSKLGNTPVRLQSSRSKRTDRVTYKKKDENLVSELNTAKPSSARREDKTNVEVCVEETVKSTKVKQLSQVNPCYEMQNIPNTTFGKEREQTSNYFTLASPARTLRSRNKSVSYKEYNSDDHSSCAEDVKSISLKRQNVVVQTDVLDRSPSLTWNNVCEISPIEKLAKRQKDVYLNSKLGSQAPKKMEKSIETKKHIWTKHRMEKTVTTMSYSKSVYSLSTDPYDFEAESKKRCDDTPSVVPLRSHLSAKDNLYGKSHSDYDKFHSASDKANYKEQDSKQFALQSASSNQAVKNKSLNNVNILNATHDVVGKWNSKPFAGKKQQHEPNYKKTPPSVAPIVKDTSHRQRNKYLSREGSVDDINSGSERGSSQYCLYASQIEQDKSVKQDKSDTGLVFPRLEDSIPCTPLPEENEEDLDSTEKKSVVSELSWLVQAKKALEKQEQKKDKTYPGHKSAETRHLTTYTEDPEPGAEYSRLHRQSSKNPDELDETCQKLKMKAGTPGKHKLFSPLDFRTVTRKPQTFHAESEDLGDDCENRAVTKNQKKKTLTPAIKNTSLELSSLSEKKSKKNLSFRSPSIIENSSSEPAGSISEDDYSLSKHQNTKSVLSAQSASNARKKCDEFLSLVSNQLDQQLQDVMDSTSRSTECNLYTGYISGPSSYKRPRRSHLKRKYPNMSTSTENSLQESDIDASEQATTSGLKPALIPRKLFKSGVTPLRPDKATSSGNKTAHALKAPTESRKCNQFSRAAEKHKKKKSGDLSHGHKEDTRDKSTPLKTSDRGDKSKYAFSERFDEKLLSTSLTGSKLVFDLCSPEKARSFNNSSWGDCLQTGLGSSPLIPLDVSSTHSSVIGFDEKSYAELNVDESGTLQQTSLLDSVREELMKSRVSQVSDEPELSTEAGALDLTETASTEMTGLQEFLLKHNMKKIPLGSDDIDGAVKSAHQRITSLWETDQRRSMNAVQKFQSVAQRIFTQMNKDLKEMQENELKVNLLWSQEMEKIRKYSMTQKKELTQLKKAHEKLFCELQRVHADSEVTQKSLKTVMKQDLDVLQRKLVAKCNDHALDAMRRCLHMSLLL